jgi:hypothetical protein
LNGAVPDADAVVQYLEKCLNVPSNQIRTLRNAQATRAEIIQNFHDLRSDTRIKFGNPVLIYFAGHGSKTSAPTGWEAGGPEIQMIAPYDYGVEDVHGIPDRTIAALLNLLAKEKGDNIVRTISHDSTALF